MIKKVFAAVAVLLFSRIDAVTTIDVRFSEQGYWYARAFNCDPDLPEEVRFPFEDFSALGDEKCLDFFQNRLPEDFLALQKLKLWSYIRSNNLRIPESEKAKLQEAAKLLEDSLQKYIGLFDSIKKFWGITTNTPIHVFHSKVNEKRNTATAFFASNFDDGRKTDSVLLTCLPPFGEKISLEGHMEIIAHEFSHSMYSAVNKQYAKAKLKSIAQRIAELPSKNAIVASWCFDETMAVVLGNGIFHEKVLGKRPEFKGAQSCEPAGLAAAVYDLVLKYFDSSRSIDDDFLKEYLRIFEELYPNAYVDPRTCLAYVSLIVPNNLNEHEAFLDIFQQFHPFSVYCEKFDELNKEKLSEISQSDSTLLIVFENESQLEKIEHFIPAFDRTKPINITHENKRTYIFMRIDAAHPFKERLKELADSKI